jgi:hypothetical protein
MQKLQSTMKRRRFVTLVALSGAALVTAPLSRAAAAARRVGSQSERHRTPTPAIRREIANQEKGLADQLKVIREFELPPGSAMAFAFKPLRTRRGR